MTDKRTRLSILVLIDTSAICFDESSGNSWYPESMANLESVCNAFIKKGSKVYGADVIDVSAIVFSDDMSDFINWQCTASVDLTLTINQDYPDWDFAFTCAMDYVSDLHHRYEENKTPHFPTRVVFFSALPPEDNYSLNTVKLVREAQESGIIELIAYGIEGVSDFAKLEALTDDVATAHVEGSNRFTFDWYLLKEIERLNQILEGARPYSISSVARAITGAIDDLKLQGISKSQVYRYLASGLEMSESTLRRRILRECRSVPWNIEQARRIYHVLNQYRNLMPVYYPNLIKQIGDQYMAALTSKVAEQSSPAAPSEITPEAVSHGKSPQALSELLNKTMDDLEVSVSECTTLQIPFDIPIDAEVTLEGLVGLEEPKGVIKKVISYAVLNKRYPRSGKPKTQFLNMFFTGNPGTGKTSVARLVTKILYGHGILKKPDLVEVGRDELVGKYVGSTAPRVVEVFKKAKGGVLFIDEAYSLVDSGRGDYGDEALATIVKEMENCGGDTVVIFAGYPVEMEALLYQNAGLKSRIKFIIDFPNYTDEEIMQIVAYTAKEYGYVLGEGVNEKVTPMVAKAKNKKAFGNARWVRSLVENAELNLASRVVKMPFEEVTEDIRNTLLVEDFEELPDSVVKPKKNTVGFAANQKVSSK